MSSIRYSNSKVLFFIDLFLIYLCFLFVYVYYNGWGSISLDALLLMLFTGMLWFVVAISTNVLAVDIQAGLVDVIKTQLTSYSVLTAGIITTVAVIGNFEKNHKLILFPLLFVFCLSTFYRSVFLFFLSHVIRYGYKQRKVLIIGGGLAAEKVMRQMVQSPELGCRLYGVIADTCAGSIPDGYYIGELNRFYDTVRFNLVDEVIIALPLSEAETIIQMVEKCEAEGVRVRIVPDFFSVVRNRVVLERLGDIPLISIRTEPLSLLRNRILKRGFDICFSAVVLLLSAPLFLVIAFLIIITSPGPVFFKQRRVGSNNVEFDIFKFRSMAVSDHSTSDTRWTTRDDPRVTWIGRFLRRTNLDEMPQFWNVIVGNMSVVGPRPERQHFVEEFRQYIRDYKVRHLVKSGITGWAQVNGWRGDTSIEKRVEHDIYYLENWSLWFDLRIIWMTIFGKKTNLHAY